MGIFSPPNSGIHAYLALTMSVADGATLRALTEIVDLKGWRPCGLFMDSAWTAAGLHFKGSPRNAVTVAPLYDEGGEVVIASASVVASTFLAFTSTAVAMETCRWFQIGSGTNASPVAQGANRSLILALLPGD